MLIIASNFMQIFFLYVNFCFLFFIKLALLMQITFNNISRIASVKKTGEQGDAGIMGKAHRSKNDVSTIYEL